MTLQADIESLPVTCLSGSAGDVVASHNQHGSYFRARTFPSQTLTLRRLLWRQAFGLSVQAWQAFTQPRRDAWQDYAHRVARTHSNSKFAAMNGFNHYMRSSVVRRRNGLSLVNDPPVATTSSQLIITHVETFGPPAQLRIFFDNTLPWASEAQGAILISASPPLSATIHFHRSPMRQAGRILGVPAPPPISPAAITYPWGTATLTVPVVLSMRISRRDGRLTEQSWYRAEPAP